MAFSGSNQEATAAIQALKQNGDALLNWALQLLQKNIDMKDHIQSCLEQVFRLTLLHNPNERDSTIEMLVRVLSATQDER